VNSKFDDSLSVAARSSGDAIEHQALPGELEVDTALLDEVVLQLNRIHAAKGIEAVRAMGEYLLARFFGGDLARFRETERRHATWREMSQRKDLHVSHSNLWYSLAILEQLRMLPTVVATALPVAVHRRLVAVRDPAAKLAIATRAAESGFTVAEVEAEIQAVAPKAGRSNRGRRRLPEWLKRARRSIRAAQSLGEVLDEGDPLEVEPAHRDDVMVELEGAIATLSSLVTRLRGPAR